MYTWFPLKFVGPMGMNTRVSSLHVRLGKIFPKIKKKISHLQNYLGFFGVFFTLSCAMGSNLPQVDVKHLGFMLLQSPSFGKGILKKLLKVKLRLQVT